MNRCKQNNWSWKATHTHAMYKYEYCGVKHLQKYPIPFGKNLN